MLLHNAPQNEAILSNVDEIGEFRIRNSAKAFNILSSGLYANKIKAIVRELSCNAVDSHTAAGKTDTPFDVHLPNQLEPWFSIRDYGTGLTHDQVTNIYTTYFESTKTASNEFIGALGLGSKSPFSYTDNFTVTAIKDGSKGIYSAFINDSGVPSIARMATEATDEPSGVEVKFSVNDYYDFSKFRDEARSVYTYFALRPVVTGAHNFEFRDIEYQTKDIVPGVHHTSGYHSVAIMGNIAYPIDVPNEETNLGNLHRLLNNGLELHFGIGELDFQASREGLSYIPQTIASIKKKLEALNAQLAVHIADEADKIDNLWERAMYLNEKKGSGLWGTAVEKYIKDTDFKFFDTNSHYGPNLIDLKIKTDALLRMNIQVRAFSKARGYSTVSNVNSSSEAHPTKKDANGKAIYYSYWRFPVTNGARFVINDTKVGASERARNHFRKIDHSRTDPYTMSVWVLEPVVKDKPMNIKGFKKLLANPPEAYFMNASDLMEKERVSTGASKMGKNVTIMRMESRGYGGYYRENEMVWKDAGKADQFDQTKTYYFIPLSGYTIDSEKFKGMSADNIHSMFHESGIRELRVDIYGVRKSDIKFIETQANWINIEKLAQTEVSKVDDVKLKTLAMSMVDRGRLIRYNDKIVGKITDKTSPYYVAAMNVKGADKVEMDRGQLRKLCEVFGVTIDVDKYITEITKEHGDIYSRYPLLSQSNYADDEHVAEYINAIDLLKK